MPASNNPEAIQSLSHFEHFANEHYTLKELPHHYKLLIRGDAKNDNFVKAIKKALNIDLPTKAYQAVKVGAKNILFNMTPDEWWLRIEQTEDFTRYHKELTKALGNIHSSIVDISDYYTIIEIEGNEIPRLLQKNSCFDFHPEKFNPEKFNPEKFNKGNATSTHYAACNIHIYALENNIFHLQTRWSHAEYVWEMLIYSAQLSTQNH